MFQTRMESSAITPSRSRTPPDFTFPPKSRYAVIKSAEEPRPKVSRTPPNFGFKQFPSPTSPPASFLPAAETMAPISPLLALSATPTSTRSPLLTIPLEIRLQIYSYLLSSSRIHHAHLAPLAYEQPTTTSGMNTEEFHTIMLRPTYITTPKSLSSSGHRTQTEERRWIIDHADGEVGEWLLATRDDMGRGSSGHEKQVRGKMPTGLLASCRQLYAEARGLPFERNTFTFINWFWSGIYAARQFTQNLAPWQRDGMRWVAIEVLGGDLWVDRAVGGSMSKGKGLREWVELCGLWRDSVRGVRVVIKGGLAVDSGKAMTSVPVAAPTNQEEANATPSKPEPKLKSPTILNPTAEWVTHGLLGLHALQHLELEISDADVPRADKVAFCAELAALLSSTSTGTGAGVRARAVKVVFAEQVEVPREVVPNRLFTWYGGEPGDDMVWGDGT